MRGRRVVRGRVMRGGNQTRVRGRGGMSYGNDQQIAGFGQFHARVGGRDGCQRRGIAMSNLRQGLAFNYAVETPLCPMHGRDGIQGSQCVRRGSLGHA